MLASDLLPDWPTGTLTKLLWIILGIIVVLGAIAMAYAGYWYGLGVKAIGWDYEENGKEMIVVRRYLLMEVTPADAKAEGTTTKALASRWASNVRRVLPQVAPTPSAFGTF